ncbi:serine/threonine-protein kinase ATM-like [Rosa rugosa]|uniref:serine/threonine-protein kinase ATM-like n=1 Tax=Rosa rugosa TaxID=74645 RepID=UPI002B417D59|nr:serine/threonine-protein kinase ATM-like [Rosa rugosa]
METPKTPETLEAAGFLDWNESCPGLEESFSNIFESNGRRVDFGHNDVGLGTMEVATQVVQPEETMLDGTKGGVLELGVHETMSGVGNSCVNDFGFGTVEVATQMAEAEETILDGTKREDLELGADAAVSGVQKSCVNDFGFSTVEVANQMVEPEETILDGTKREDLELGADAAISGVQKSCVNGVGVEEVYIVNTHVDVGDEAQMVSKLLQSEKENDHQNVSVELRSVDDDHTNEDKALGLSTNGSQRDDDGVEKMFEDVKVEKMVEDFRVEKMVEDGGVEKMVEDGGVEKMVEDGEVEKMVGYDGVQKIVDDDHMNEDKASGLSMDGGQREDDGVEKMSEDGGDEKMSEDGGVEKMFKDGGVEKTVEDDGVEKAKDDDGMNEAKALASSIGGSQREDDVGKILVDDDITEDKALGSDGIESAVDLTGNKQEVSGDGISLFVDFTGPPPGFIVDMGPGITSKGNAQEFGDDELEKGEDDQDYDFSVGDIVWVKTKIKTWWPGRIHDPVDASKYGMVSDQEGCLLVGYFGMGHVAWCRRYQLKPFPQYFEQISGQSKARIFVGAVEKALEEFGGRVKLNMTCACILKENRLSVDGPASKEGVPDRNSSELGEFSVTHFDSAKFLAHLKNLAQVVSKVGILDYTVTLGRLSAFYSSTGHSQLPMHLLQEGNDAESGADGTLLMQTDETILHQEKNDKNEAFAKLFGGGSADKTSISSSKSRKRKMKRDSEIEETSLVISSTVKESNASSLGNGDGGNEGMIEIGAESRERKKSRYLSYPYVNWGQKGLSAEGMAATTDGGPPSNFKSTGEKFWRKWHRRFTGVNNISGNSNVKNTSSAELLSEFCSAAIGCQYPIENKAFDSVAWFISNFRISVFHDEPICETYSKNMAGQDEDKDAEPCLLENGGQNEAKSEPKKRNKKAVSKQSEGEDAANTSSLVQSPATAVEGMNGNLGKKRGRPKLGRSKTKSLSGMSDVNTSIAPDVQMVQDSSAVSPLMRCDKAKRKKREKVEGASQASLQTKQTIGIPDLNGNSVLPTVLVNDQQTIGHAASESKIQLEKRLGTETSSEHSIANMAPGLVDANGNNLKPGTLVVDLGIPLQALPCLDSNQVTSLLSADSKPAPKKRKRKEKVDPGVPVQADSIPDLNGNGAECLTPPSKPERKKRRRKGEGLATALLLTFASGVPMPSKDDLISTFCRFGPLKESETQFLTDPSSAQVVFMESADAGEAFQSLEKNNPFGTNLVSYRRFNLPSVSKVLATSLASPPTKRLLSPVQSPGKGPCLDVIRQNLQMMTSMLEKSGDTLSPEMRTKLECEIKGLLQKVSSTAGSSSA